MIWNSAIPGSRSSRVVSISGVSVTVPAPRRLAPSRAAAAATSCSCRLRTEAVARARYIAVAALVVIGVAGLVLGHAVPGLVIGVATLVVTTALAAATQLRSAREASAAGTWTLRPQPDCTASGNRFPGRHARH
jgi:hypothetical protein